ncbi:MAG: MoxR family ATPase [Flavobacteriales bacterium]|nr:MoxR family ATPase [Flavobacteriales bacterium]
MEEAKISFESDVKAVDSLVEKYGALRKEIAKVIVGQDDVIQEVLISIFSRGHCLLIGVPGLAKTLLVNTISKTLGLGYSRIQFTPDLMPSDILGTEILDMADNSQTREFRFIKGPLFANIILADEINRCPPKTQAALLEAMEERAVTVAGKRYEMGNPFFVLATQNPIEQEGTYPLPEAQLDRFMFNVWLDYPTVQQELKVVKQTTGDYVAELNEILSAEEIIAYQKLIRKIPVPDNVTEYAVKLTTSTRPGRNDQDVDDYVKSYISWGAGPRASQYLILGAKCHAAINGKYSPDIEDVQAVAKPILRHRLIRNYKAEANGVSVEDIIENLLKR